MQLSGNVRRQRTILVTSLTGLLSKSAAFLPALGIVPVAAPVLGVELFGVLMTVLSVYGFLQVADLGVGGNLVTSVSRAVGGGKVNRIRLLQWNGIAIIIVIMGVLGCAAIGLALSNFGAIMLPDSETSVQNQATHALTVFIILFAMSMPLTLITKVQLGMQDGHIANISQMIAALINFATGAIVTHLGGQVPAILAGLMVGTFLCGIANVIVHFRRHPALSYARHSIRLSVARKLFVGSLLYLALQVIFLVSYAMDTLIVARQLGLEEVSGFAIADRLFGIVAVAVGIFTAPLWAAYGEALGNKDYCWARRCLRTSLFRLTLLSCLMCSVLVLTFPSIVSFLGQGAVQAPFSLAVAMAAWRVVESIGSAVSVYLFASEGIRFVLLCGSATAIASLIGKLLLVNTFGAIALPLTTLICFTFLCLIPCLIYLRNQEIKSANRTP